MRHGRRLHRAVVVLALMATASACGQRSTPIAGVGTEESAPVGSAGREAAPRGPSGSTAPAGGLSSAAAARSAGSTPSPGPFVAPYPADPAVLVDAILSPVCAHNGTQMTLVVKTNPKAAVGYQARYSDNHGGGPAPYGRGYGGNGHGLADDAGHFRSVWVISETAPAGVARVDVVVGWAGKYGYQSLTFHVGPGATCT